LCLRGGAYIIFETLGGIVSLSIVPQRVL
jgi:hypothetical protein